MSVDLTPVGQGTPGFKLVGSSLECSFSPNNPAHRIAAKVLQVSETERQSLVPQKSKWTCCCFKPRWITCEVLIGTEKKIVSLKIEDLVQKWQLTRDQVLSTSLEELAQSAFPAGSQTRPCTPVPPSVASVETTTDSPPPSVASLTNTASSADFNSESHGADESKNSLTGEPTDEELAAHGLDRRTLGTLRQKTLTKRSGSGRLRGKLLDESKMAPADIFDQFPLIELRRFIRSLPESEQTKLINLFRKDWPGIQRLIETKADSWKASCLEKGALSMIIRPSADSSLHLEFFFEPESLWVHFNALLKQYALNLSKGILCRRTVIDKPLAEKLILIQRLSEQCPSIQMHAVSAFESSSKEEIHRVMTPFFSFDMRKAQQKQLITNQTRDRIVLDWLKGLALLHSEDIAHFALFPENLLVQQHSDLVVGVIGGFTKAFLTSKPPSRISITEDFHKLMPPECDANDSANSFTVPINAKAVDIFQLGSCLREIYDDLFKNAFLDDQTREGRIHSIIRQMINPDGLRISAVQARDLWENLPPSNQ